MTYKEKTKAICASILLIIKNATVVIPVIEGIIYSIIDLIQFKKEKKDAEERLKPTADGYNYRDDEH